MKKNFAVLPMLVMGVAALAHAQGPSKVAIIHVQNAILSTKDGEKARAELTTRFSPRQSDLEKKQSEIASLQDQLKKGNATMSDDAKSKLMRDIDARSTSLKRAQEDVQADVEQEEGRIMNELGQKMMDVIIKYATGHGYSMVVDISSPQTPVLWADPAIDITNEIVKLYDQANPGAGTAPAAAAPKPGGSAAPAVTRPAAPATPPSAAPPPKKK